MKWLSLATLSLLILAACTSTPRQAKVKTKYFEFHNHYWLNLHHFLYQKAKGSQFKKLQEDGLGFVSIGEDLVMEQLNDVERAKLNRSIEYYKKHWIDKDLRRDLGKLRRWLQDADPATPIRDSTFSWEYTYMLNLFSPVYRQHFWKLHQSLNKKVLEQHLPAIQALESKVIPQMEQLSGNPWPDSTIVRVDLSTYANWAGAYTSTRPKINIVLSTIDSLNGTSSFVETIFHEGTHLLYLFEQSPFREKIYEKSKAMGMEFPKNLWHAGLFYLCGRASQDALQTLNIDHAMLMEVRNIFPTYYTPAFRAILEEYYQGMITMDHAIDQLLVALNTNDQ